LKEFDEKPVEAYKPPKHDCVHGKPWTLEMLNDYNKIAYGMKDIKGT
jgi:hypothetical protein